MARLTTDFRALLQEGVDLFNRRAFFEAHEAWEAIWRMNPGEPAYFLHGLIQIAAGFVKLQRGEPKGAAALLAKGARKLERFSPGSRTGSCGTPPTRNSHAAFDSSTSRMVCALDEPGATSPASIDERVATTIENRG